MRIDDVGSRLIKSARTGAGLTQTALALRAGEPQSVISAYERGRRQPSAAALGRLVEAAGYRLVVVPAPTQALDLNRAAQQLAQLLDLAEQLPAKRRSPRLGFPRLPM